MTLAEAARDFLAQDRIAVVGVSRQAGEAANFVFRKLRDAGHTVFPVNPRTGEVEHVPCYPNVRSIPGGVGAVLIFTPPAASADVVRECADLGITRVWLHRSLGPGSVSAEALQVAEERHLTVIAGGCPAMFCAPVDLPHRCMRWVLDWTGKLPQHVGPPAA